MNGARWMALVLAAGKGTRMRSERAKVLHEIEGKSLLGHVLDTAHRLPLEQTIVVVGHQANVVREAHQAWPISYAVQEPQLGTGHAVLVARELLQAAFLEDRENWHLLVLYGDVPLLRASTLSELMERHLLEAAGVTVLSARLPDPKGYGRILRDQNGGFRRITEDKDLLPEERVIDEVNSGIYTFALGPLLSALAELKADNAQKEYYLTDTLELALHAGHPVSIFQLADAAEISGINTPEQLADAEAVLRARRVAGNGEGCSVCQLLREDSPLVLRRERGLAILLSPEPYNSGHLWIAPERHIVSTESLTSEERGRILAQTAEAENWLAEAYRAEGLNVGWNSGAAGQHLVAHVVPRWSGDSNFMQIIADTNLLPESLNESRERLLAAMQWSRQDSA